MPRATLGAIPASALAAPELGDLEQIVLKRDPKSGEWAVVAELPLQTPDGDPHPLGRVGIVAKAPALESVMQALTSELDKMMRERFAMRDATTE